MPDFLVSPDLEVLDQDFGLLDKDLDAYFTWKLFKLIGNILSRFGLWDVSHKKAGVGNRNINFQGFTLFYLQRI